MARSPFTLAAAVTAALPGAEVNGARPLSAGGDGRFDSAVATLADGRELAIRVADDDEAARELAAEALALRALTPGARAILPFRAPQYIGETRLGDGQALVTDLLPGFQVEAAHIPAGRGAAASMGSAIAAVHALPASVVRGAGLPARDAEQIREDIRQVVDRAAATGHVPARLTVRWREAVSDDELWRFESTVTLGGVQATSFLFEDDPAEGPLVVGLAHWFNLSLGDPAIDLAWLSSAPDAADSVLASYAHASDRSPDGALAVRGRLLAELEFARWLLHGESLHRADIVEDAAGLLVALAEGLRDDDLAVIAERATDVDSAMEALQRVPATEATGVDTSMQTDAYNPEDLRLLAGLGGDEADDVPPGAGLASLDTVEILPGEATEDLSDARFGAVAHAADESEDVSGSAAPEDAVRGDDGSDESGVVGTGSDEPGVDEAQRAARAALQRWAKSDSE